MIKPVITGILLLKHVIAKVKPGKLLFHAGAS